MCLYKSDEKNAYAHFCLCVSRQSFMHLAPRI